MNKKIYATKKYCVVFIALLSLSSSCVMHGSVVRDFSATAKKEFDKDPWGNVIYFSGGFVCSWFIHRCLPKPIRKLLGLGSGGAIQYALGGGMGLLYKYIARQDVLLQQHKKTHEKLEALEKKINSQSKNIETIKDGSTSWQKNLTQTIETYKDQLSAIETSLQTFGVDIKNLQESSNNAFASLEKKIDRVSGDVCGNGEKIDDIQKNIEDLNGTVQTGNTETQNLVKQAIAFQKQSNKQHSDQIEKLVKFNKQQELFNSFINFGAYNKAFEQYGGDI